MPIASMTVVAHGTEEKNVAETMKDLILEELNVREMKFLEDETKLVKLSAKPNFLAIKAKGPDYAKNMKVISAKLNSPASLPTAWPWKPTSTSPWLWT